MMAKLSIRCLYKRYHLLNALLDNRVSFSSALSESRRLFLRSLSVRSLDSAVSKPRHFSSPAKTVLDNRVSSSSATHSLYGC